MVRLLGAWDGAASPLPISWLAKHFVAFYRRQMAFPGILKPLHFFYSAKKFFQHFGRGG